MTASPSKLKVLDLFSGIGGFSLGLERTGGFETVAFCEICPKARKVLRKHWADVPIYNDIKDLTHDRLASRGIFPTVIAGGFPCTDISHATQNQLGLKGEQSGLWSEMLRLITEVRPQWAIIENVPALLYRGLTLVLQNLCEIGYLSEWHCISAAQIGARHKRDRVWIIARKIEVPNTVSLREEGRDWEGCTDGERFIFSYESGRRTLGSEIDRRSKLFRETQHWEIESPVPRVLDGISNRLDRCKQLGNSVVPQIPELLGNAILEVEVNNV